MTAYAFKDKQDVVTLKKVAASYNDPNQNELSPEDVSFTTTVNVCLNDDPIDGLGSVDDDEETFTLTVGEGIRMRKLG